MRLLRISNLILMPRVAPTVSGVLDNELLAPATEEQLIELSPACQKCYESILTLIEKGLRDLQKSQPSLLDVADTSVHGKLTFLKQLDRQLMETVDLVWQRLRQSEKRIFKDLQTMRELLASLLIEDCCRFYLQIRNLRTTDSSTSGLDPSWFLASEFDVLFANSKERVFSAKRNPVSREPQFSLRLEENSKLTRVREIIEETLRSSQISETSKEIFEEVKFLIVTDSESLTRQVADTLAFGPIFSLVQSLKQLLHKERLIEERRRRREELNGISPQSLLVAWLEKEITQLSLNLPPSLVSLVASEKLGDLCDELDPWIESLGLKVKCRVRFITVSEENLDALEEAVVRLVPHCVILSSLNLQWMRQVETGLARIYFSAADLDRRKELQSKREESKTEKLDPPKKRARVDVSFGSRLLKLTNAELGLSDLEVEEFAPRQGLWLTGSQVRVVVLGYIGTTEEHDFMECLKTEQTAWDNLVHQRESLLVFEKDSDLTELSELNTADERFRWMLTAGREVGLLSSRQAGGGLAKVTDELRTQARKLRILHGMKLDVDKMSREELFSLLKPTVLIDMREFRSGLPCQLWNTGLRIVPLTLPVADYVLTRDMGVERKSLPDLIQSLVSGRLYRQCERLVRTFRVPTLLIEFDSASRGFIRSMTQQSNEAGQTVVFHHSKFHLGARTSVDLDPSLILAK
eukprot:Gregarina_sp_Poly_1__3087@NODE_186_length_11711_cov_65_603057_g165_i0_p1_GENE_NODE_186_length_11711_cov_65_603057_g165_i0NODE_186_length_11711_cov_65_603057_g165_i0_p1_ORF_typecomplete_len693_score129_97ERCC4/PF02732_15/8_6e02ERCC4/PF02732_15/9_7e22_NODE_186_length_11711_cov_65_603057_g165_i066648742